MYDSNTNSPGEHYQGDDGNASNASYHSGSPDQEYEHGKAEDMYHSSDEKDPLSRDDGESEFDKIVEENLDKEMYEKKVEEKAMAPENDNFFLNQELMHQQEEMQNKNNKNDNVASASKENGSEDKSHDVGREMSIEEKINHAIEEVKSK